MGKSLSEIVKKTTLGLGLAGVLALGGGCMQLAGLALKGNAMKTRNQLAARDLGDAIIDYGNTHDRESEENGNNNRNNGNNSDQQQPVQTQNRSPHVRTKPPIYTSDYADSNEKIGKEIFKRGEPLYVAGSIEFFKSGLPIWNYCICVTTGETFAKEKKKNIGADNYCGFNSTALYDYKPNSVWENVWVEEQPDGSFKELGRVKWV